MSRHKSKMELLRRPSWHDKRRLSDDDTLQTFLWAYGTGELMDELNRVREIGTLADKIEAGEPQYQVCIQVSFDEAFIDSHATLVMLMDRLTDCWNVNARQDILNVSSSLPPDSVFGLYRQANIVFNGICDSLLHMRRLYEQLKPETRDLIRRCSGQMQLQRSMIAQRGQRTQGGSPVFKPACGFVLRAHSSAEDEGEPVADEKEVQVTLRDRIAAIDVQMARLQCEKEMLMGWQRDVENHAAELEVYTILHNTLAEGKRMEDPIASLQYAKDTIAPQQHIIRFNTRSFKSTLQAFPVSYPSVWTKEDSFNFFQCMSDALEHDHTQLCKLVVRHMKTEFEW